MTVFSFNIRLLKPGEKDYNEINDVTIILVAPFDIFGYGLYRYTFEGYCKEVPNLRINDGAKRIFINTKGKNAEDLPEEFVDFMAYINSSTDEIAGRSKSDKLHRIHQQVCKVRKSEEVGVNYMLHWEEIAEEREEAREEGLKEGREKGREEGAKVKTAQVIINMFQNNFTIADIAKITNEDEDYINNICNLAKKYGSDYDIDKIVKELL